MTVTTLEPGRVVLNHLPGQFDFFTAQDRQVALVAGLGYGKTRVACDWMIAGILEYPLAGHGVFSNTYPQMLNGTLRSFFARCDDWGVLYVDRVKSEHRVYFPQNGAILNVWSNDDPGDFKSLELSRIWIDEAQHWDKDSYDKVYGRLRGTDLSRSAYPGMRDMLRISANPTHTFNHWLYELTHTQIDPLTDKPPIRIITATTFDNPFLSAEYINGMLAAYDPEIARAEIYGEFIELGKGRVYRRFSLAKHMLTAQELIRRGLPPVEADPNLPICWAHDFNLDPLCSVLFQWRRIRVPGYQRDVMFILGEIRIENALIQDAPRVLLEKFPRIAAIAKHRGMILYGDASGNQGNRQTGQSDWAALKIEMARLGFHGEGRVPPADPERHDRFAAANRMFEDAIPATAPWISSGIVQGHLGVVMHESCKYLALDFTKAYFKPGTFVIDRPKARPGEVLPAAQKMFHLADACTYAISHDFPYVEPDQGGKVLTIR